ncbi:hypothetical protein BT69DRAFT_1344873 [Atractiella rhizophila]|nr:hypothetical protein BT69DRAFT_1344873 [Atractiella rhizophila]
MLKLSDSQKRGASILVSAPHREVSHIPQSTTKPSITVTTDDATVPMFRMLFLSLFYFLLEDPIPVQLSDIRHDKYVANGNYEDTRRMYLPVLGTTISPHFKQFFSQMSQLEWKSRIDFKIDRRISESWGRHGKYVSSSDVPLVFLELAASEYNFDTSVAIHPC